MGTSQSKPNTPGGGPLVPPWADQDPPPPDQAQPPPASPNTLPAAPFLGVRVALRDYLTTGDRRLGRRALGRYARAVGGGQASARHSRAARAGGSAIAAIAAVAGAGGAPVTIDGFDLGALAGLPLEDAIGAIVDRFCPAGILDEDMARAAVAESLFIALDGSAPFDLSAIDDRTIVVATASFVAELVFASVALEQGNSADGVAPDIAVRRENDLRDLIREVADQAAVPVIQRAGSALDARTMEGLISQITATVYEEMSHWRT